MHKAELILIFMQTNKQKQNPQKKKHPSYVSLKNVNPLTSCSIWNIGDKRVKQDNLKTIHRKAVNFGIDFMQYFGQKLEMDQTEI